MLQNVSVWWHVFGAAAVVLILALVPERHQSVQFVFTETFNNSGFADGSTGGLTVLVLRPAAGLPAHPVHDHRLRRLRPRVGGDQGRLHGGGARVCGSPSSTRPSAAGSCCWPSCSRRPTSTRSTRRAASPGPSSQTALTPVLLQGRHHHLDHRAVLLRHELRDEHVPDDVRVQPRPGRPRLADVVEGEPQPHTGQRHHRRHRRRRPAHAAGAVQEPPPACRSRSTPSSRSASSACTWPS